MKKRYIHYLVFTIIVSLIVVFVILWSVSINILGSPIENNLYSIKIRDSTLIEIFEIQGGATSSDYLQIRKNRDILYFESINSPNITNIQIVKDSVLISFINSYGNKRVISVPVNENDEVEQMQKEEEKIAEKSIKKTDQTVLKKRYKKRDKAQRDYTKSYGKQMLLKWDKEALKNTIWELENKRKEQ